MDGAYRRSTEHPPPAPGYHHHGQQQMPPPHYDQPRYENGGGGGYDRYEAQGPPQAHMPAMSSQAPIGHYPTLPPHSQNGAGNPGMDSRYRREGSRQDYGPPSSSRRMSRSPPPRRGSPPPRRGSPPPRRGSPPPRRGSPPSRYGGGGDRRRSPSPGASRYRARGPDDRYSRPDSDRRESRYTPSRPVERGTEEDRSLSTTLYVGNMPYHWREGDVSDMFERYGRLRAVTVVMDRVTHRNKGFAFIEYEDRRDAEDAREKYNDMEFDGRRLRIDWDIGLNKKMIKRTGTNRRGGDGGDGPREDFARERGGAEGDEYRRGGSGGSGGRAEDDRRGQRADSREGWKQDGRRSSPGGFARS